MIDWERVAQLREEVGPEDFGEVVELFLEEVDEAIRRLTQISVRDRLEEELHFLKGSALNLGFVRFGQLCQEGEKLAARGEEGAVDVGAILACYGVSRALFLDGADRAVA